LTGSGGRDWFFARIATADKDLLPSRLPSEVLDQI
jgi:hypothetical protein